MTIIINLKNTEQGRGCPSSFNIKEWFLMNNMSIDDIVKLIEEKYGKDNDTGCYCNGSWLSPQSIIELITGSEEEDY